MMSFNQRLNVVKLNELKRNFSFPDDYLIRIVPKCPEMFRLINYSGRKSSLEVELISWNSELATSCVEISAKSMIQSLAFHVHCLQHGLKNGRGLMSSIQHHIFHLTQIQAA